MKAVIMAAGEGTRLEPLTNVRPKPMVPIANKPLLEYVIEAVASAGIDEIVLIVGYKRERIQNYVGDGDEWGVDITYVVQESQLGTGDALLQAEPHIGGDFIALNGDRIIDAALVSTLIEERQQTGDTLMAVTRVDEPELYGVVETDSDDQLTSIREKPPASAVTSNLINAGVYAIGPGVFAAIRATETRGELDLTAVLKEHLDSHPIRTVPYDGAWLDVTRPWDLLHVNGRALDWAENRHAGQISIDETAAVSDLTAIGDGVAVRPNATVLRGTSLGENVTVGPNAVLNNAVVFPDATIGAGAVLTDCIVGANATIGPNVTITGGDADVVLSDTVHRNVKFGGIIGDNASVDAAVTVDPGTILGNGAVVASGTQLSGCVDPGTHVQH